MSYFFSWVCSIFNIFICKIKEVNSIIVFCLKRVIFLSFRYLVIIIGFIINKKKMATKAQGRPFECGVGVLEFNEVPIRMRFYMLMVVFLIFDVELVLLMPFTLYVFEGFGAYITLIFVTFLMVLLLRVFVEWRQRLLEWR